MQGLANVYKEPWAAPGSSRQQSSGTVVLRGGLQLNSPGVQDRLVGMFKLNNSCTVMFPSF